MDILHQDQQPAVQGPAETFSGQVQINGLFTAPSPAEISTGTVTFEAGARTHWHTHPLGQLLIVTDGEGWIQIEGEARQDIRTGDMVWIEPHKNHWHGAQADKSMTHIAIQQSEDGSPVAWGEAVTNTDYAPELSQ
ncbi:cupin domain-containing protein [Oceanicaulis sp. LC35]|uniref:(R)-mandelonitrile lyase n=1 Tax=Oceanicaulis sp. LC35 TaxID=3349635 RepID=UPI003F86A4FB